MEAGLGIALLPSAWLADALRTGAVVPLDWFAPPFEVVTQVAWHPARWQGPALSAVLEASEACIPEAPRSGSGALAAAASGG